MLKGCRSSPGSQGGGGMGLGNGQLAVTPFLAAPKAWQEEVKVE